MKRYIAIDAGGTATRAGLYDASRRLLAEAAGAGCNPVDAGLRASIAGLTVLTRELIGRADGPIERVAAAVAGAGAAGALDAFAEALHGAAGACAVVTTDVRAPLFANAGNRLALVAVAGTGSCVLGQDDAGREVRAGGRGVFFGDAGSAHRIAAEALRAVARAADGLGSSTALEGMLGAATEGFGGGALALWAARASKREIARLCPVVFEAAAQGDAIARDIVVSEAGRLAELVCAAAARLGAVEAPVYLVGGVFEHAADFRAAFCGALRQSAPSLRPELAPLRGHRAALELALADSLPGWATVCASTDGTTEKLPRTEQAAREHAPLDRLDAEAIARAMSEHDTAAAAAVAAKVPAIAAAIAAAAQSLKAGGRLIYVGAGTSGRLGALDAAECPPTFGVSPDRVLALIAGGTRALRESVEGAEDDAAQALADIEAIDPCVSERDFVVGIAASGRTVYVEAALDWAKTFGARVGLICAVPDPVIRADVVIAVDTGPEALPGSTRLKAGTATKQVLNMISTGAFALAGFVYEGQMIGVRPLNAKLRRRAVRIIRALTGLAPDAADAAFEAAGRRIPVAVLMCKKGLSRNEAEQRLGRAGGVLRDALDSE